MFWSLKETGQGDNYDRETGFKSWFLFCSLGNCALASLCLGFLKCEVLVIMVLLS